ncbi:MAG: hypothetical protein HRU19_18145 [Pseudobacteriovorax sp.]|nr:hypothetical protein [Pseudobacteriovorax sp.]
MSISINIVHKDGDDLVEYVGPIDAESEVHLEQLIPKLGEKINFNFKHVESVNSCGVRSWINFMRELEKSDKAITFSECTSEIVMQINMIPSFKGNAEIASVYGDYVCDECGFEKTILFRRGENLPKGIDSELPKIDCEQCKSEMELEELEEEYFAFLESA